MDDQRFDNLSRIIARSTTRRTTVKGIAAVIGGGVFASVFGVRAQRAGAQEPGQPGDPCGEGVECVTGNCSAAVDGVCYCEDPAEPWRGCDCDTGTEAPCGGGSLICCATGDEPGGAGICTSSSTGCNPTGECTADPGGECASDTDCCTGTCSDEGVCFCSDPDRPWIGCPCTTGTEDPCGGELCCPTGSEPGGPGVCTSTMAGCETPGECTAEDDACSSSDECCDELICLDSGVCGIPTDVVLPTTGSGMSDGSNLGAWIGATAALGAAAAIAGRKINPKSTEGSN